MIDAEGKRNLTYLEMAILKKRTGEKQNKNSQRHKSRKKNPGLNFETADKKMYS